MATYTGLFVSVVTFLAVVGYTIGRLVEGDKWPAGFATTTILILLSLSLNATFLGVIGEYVGRIYHQVRRRPLTIIETQIDRAPARREHQPLEAVFFAEADGDEEAHPAAASKDRQDASAPGPEMER
jgi:dolichol-phosphate mannosyltransferase